jgi:hypothetical protein
MGYFIEYTLKSASIYLFKSSLVCIICKLNEVSAGKDTLTGHYEIMGLKVEKPSVTFTETGFPDELINELETRWGRKIIGNKSASGTEIIKELGERHMQTGEVIVYTSADSVLQIAANEAIIPLKELYKMCEIAREVTLKDEWKVDRIIARPFMGTNATNFTRTSNRHDYATSPFAPTYMDNLKEAGYDVIAIGKINDIFNGQIDIHGGGNDLKFPHHENEIAQEMCMHNSTIANYWLHNARIDLAGEKMSKSLGNVVWAKDLLEKYPYQAVRLMILSNHYRQSIAYKDELIERSCTEWDKISRTYLSLYRELELSDIIASQPEEKYLPDFLNSMADDFNTPNAFTALYGILKEINTSMRANPKNYDNLTSLKTSLDIMLNILGIIPDIEPLTEEGKELLIAWKKARTEKNFALADELRLKITELGIKF